jgi:N-acetylneuraminic acid mutarotase
MGKLLVLVLASMLIFSALTIVRPALADTNPENSWTQLAPMSQPRAGLGVAVVNDKIYAIGGVKPIPNQYPQDEYLKINEEYDPTTNTWITKASMPTPRGGFAIAAYQEKIYCIGGVNGMEKVEPQLGPYWRSVYSNVNEVYDTITGIWETKAPLPVNGSVYQAHVLDGKIFLITASVIYVYNPEEDSWASKTQLPASAKSAPVSAALDNQIFVTGEFSTGTPLSYEQKMLIYSPSNDSWTEGSSGPIIIGQGGAGVTTGFRAPTRVYVLGVSINDFPYRLVNLAYDPENDAWSSATAMLTKRTGYGLVVLNDVLYVIGGYDSTGANPTGVNEEYFPLGYSNVPKINIFSPLLQKYNVSSVSLNFTLDRPVSWVGYSLDGVENVTVTGNFTLKGLSNGSHNVTVYANDTYGSMSASQTMYFIVDVPENFLMEPILIGVIIVVVLFAVALLVLALRRHRKTANNKLK